MSKRVARVVGVERDGKGWKVSLQLGPGEQVKVPTESRHFTLGALVTYDAAGGSVEKYQSVDESLVLPTDLRAIIARDIPQDATSGRLLEDGIQRSPLLARSLHVAILDAEARAHNKSVARTFQVHRAAVTTTRELVHVGMATAYRDGAFRDAQSVMHELTARQEAALIALATQRGEACAERTYQVSWRMCVGLASPSAWEAGMAVHGLTGVPVIPSSALIGAVKRCAAEYGVDLSTIIGGKGEPRPLVVADAVPLRGADVVLEADVVTPHFGNYYRSDSSAMSDDDDAKPGTVAGQDGAVDPMSLAADAAMNPKPSTFLTVAFPTCFVVRVVGPVEHLHVFTHWLSRALREFGVGAKTNAGYGRLVELEPQEGAR